MKHSLMCSAHVRRSYLGRREKTISETPEALHCNVISNLKCETQNLKLVGRVVDDLQDGVMMQYTHMHTHPGATHIHCRYRWRCSPNPQVVVRNWRRLQQKWQYVYVRMYACVTHTDRQTDRSDRVWQSLSCTKEWHTRNAADKIHNNYTFEYTEIYPHEPY